MISDRAAAIVALLEQSDPVDLRPRAHHLTQVGDPTRQRRWIRRLPNMHTAIVRQDRSDESDARRVA